MLKNDLSAKDNGADFVKTQIFDTKFLTPGPWDKDGRKNIYKKAQLKLKINGNKTIIPKKLVSSYFHQWLTKKELIY